NSVAAPRLLARIQLVFLSFALANPANRGDEPHAEHRSEPGKESHEHRRDRPLPHRRSPSPCPQHLLCGKQRQECPSSANTCSELDRSQPLLRRGGSVMNPPQLRALPRTITNRCPGPPAP